ncbi:MAG TPA: metalloendopeptidase, partial [Candidatus Hydrogenedentes bacterium]|nr:metalloendopeptidase [Candidatus Hydrogenedentota bacterium]
MRFFSVIFCLSLALTATAADFSVLPANPDGTPHAAMMYKYLLHEAEGCLNARMEAYEALKTEADILAWQENLRSRFTESLGGFPERCPLNARITGQGEKEHFRYEKVIFESQPGLLVTAILYLPKGQGPWPGVIVPCGHAAEGKGMDAYQRASMLLAANGTAALCYDPIGQ